MEAIILAGGLGTRLRDVVPDLPKPMAPISGRPFLEILLGMLAKQGCNRVVLSLGYRADTVVRHFGDRYGDVELVYEIETTPLGTGGALRRALTHVTTDHVFVLNGDTYLDLELSEIEALWQDRRLPIIVAREVPDTLRYGRLAVNGARVNGFAEKGRSGRGLINAGAYLFPADITRRFPAQQAFSLEQDFLATAVTRSPFLCHVSRGRFIDIGIPEEYARAQLELAETSS